MNTQVLTKVWDLPLRIFHWLLVAGLLLFRLVWGMIGNEYARFSSFLCSPDRSIAYVKDLVALKTKRYLGHNPAGAAMIVLLLVSLLATVITGFAVYGADQAAGPLASIGSGNEKMWEEVHEFFANFTLVLVFVHVVGVAVESYIHRENLAKAMVHGYKKSLEDTRD